MGKQAATLAGNQALYELHLSRLAAIKSGAVQHAYDGDQITEFERETARLKALLDAARSQPPR